MLLTNTVALLDELELIAKKYAELKQARGHGEKNKNNNHAEIARLATSIVDAISLPSFSFPLKEETQVVSGTTTYLYENNATFPALYDFLAELLHSKIPIEVSSTKFGPGEIIVSKEIKSESDAELGASVKELVHAKRSDVLSKHAETADNTP